MGIPLIEAIYGGDPNIALYTLPLLVWYPIQIIVGSLLADRLRSFVRSENARLGIDEEVLSLDSDDWTFFPLKVKTTARRMAHENLAKRRRRRRERARKERKKAVDRRSRTDHVRGCPTTLLMTIPPFILMIHGTMIRTWAMAMKTEVLWTLATVLYGPTRMI